MILCQSADKEDKRIEVEEKIFLQAPCDGGDAQYKVIVPGSRDGGSYVSEDGISFPGAR